MTDATNYLMGGNLLNAAKVKAGFEGKPLKIYGSQEVVIKEKKKLAISFEGMEELLALNATNLNVLIKAFGKESDGWKGKTISLITIPTKYQGTIVDSILVRV